MNFGWKMKMKLIGILFLLCLALPATAQLSFQRSLGNTGEYIPGTMLEVTLTMDWLQEQSLTAIGVEETLPEGWLFSEVIAGDEPAIAPAEGTTGLLEFAWVPTPTELPLSMTYRVMPPAEESGTVTFSGRLLYYVRESPGEEFRVTLESAVPQWGPHTFYVDAAQTVSGDGSQEAPFTSIAQAVSASAATREDTILIYPGAYDEAAFSLPESTRIQGIEEAYDTLLQLPDGNPAFINTGCRVRRLTVGGAGFSVADGAEVLVQNCIFHDAEIAVDIGEGANATLTNLSFYAHSEAGIQVGEEAVLSLHNSIFTQCASAITAAADASVSGDYLLFSDNGVNYSSPLSFAHQVSEDPLFIDPDALNFHVQAASPAIDAGHPEETYFDRDGSINDLGADGGPNGDWDQQDPVAAFSVDVQESQFDMGTTVAFDASASQDEWGIAHYQWDFDLSDGVGEDATGPTAKHTFSTPGVYTTTLRVWDHRARFADATWQCVVLTTIATISGEVRDESGDPISGVALDALSLAGVQDASTTSDATGAYQIILPLDWTGSLEPRKTDWTFDPESYSFSALQEDVPEVDFVGTPVCVPPAAPADVTASKGVATDLIVVQWSAVQGAVAYRIERSVSEDFTNPQVMAEIVETEYRDTSALPPEITQTGWGCFKEDLVTLKPYYYRVTSVGDCADSSPSLVDEGYRGASKALLASMGDLLLILALCALLAQRSVASPRLASRRLDRKA